MPLPHPAAGPPWILVTDAPATAPCFFPPIQGSTKRFEHVEQRPEADESALGMQQPLSHACGLGRCLDEQELC